MRAFTSYITVAIGTFLLGWAMSSELDTPDHGTNSSVSSQTNHFRAPRNPARRTGDSDLPNIDACRALLASSKESDSRHPLLRKLDRERALRRWIVLDPDSAMKEAEKNPSSQFSKDLFLAWVSLNPSNAIHRLNQGSTFLQRALSTGVFIALFQKDAHLAAEELQSSSWKNKGTSRLGWGFYSSVYRQWALSDLSAAIASLPQNNSEGKQYTGDAGQLAIMKVWAKTDIQGTWAYLFPEGGKRNFRPSWDASKLLARGLLGGADGVDEILNKDLKRLPQERLERLSYIADAMVRINPRDALKWANSRPADDPLRGPILAHAASNFASSDPERALKMLAESGNVLQTYVKASIFRESFASLASLDPIKAAGMVRGLPENQRKDAMSGYLTNMFSVDPEGAIDQCNAWLNDPTLGSQVPAAWAKSFSWAHGAGARDPGPILEAIPALNDAVDGRVLSTWAKANPKAAAQWIKQRLEDGHSVKVVGPGVLADLAIQEPQFTADWLSELPASDMQVKAANTLVANWAAFDPDAAQAWIDSLPQSNLRKSAEEGLTRIHLGRIR